ncbi:hypothetical protein [Rhizobium rhizogenes]|uniref:hypothetical protein n=1 Tax=Rhizobium rhizogenes TaxID=359 RepID=UPI0015730FE7|nr:hypothetical protein [Rhizobium rhizogenes]NTG07188.1 hypothetical protein [Rhizobium rhizogenes]
MTTAKELSDQISKAMEGVTPGPWAYQRPDTYVKGHMGTANVRVVAQMDESRRGLTNWQADLGYIAAVQPDNMRVILSALADAELQSTADARIAELEQQIANIKASRDCHVTIAAGEEERARKAEADRDQWKMAAIGQQGVTMAAVSELSRIEEKLAEAVKVMEFYRDGFKYHPKRSSTGINLSEWKPTPALIDDCGETARSFLSKLEASSNAKS